MGFSGAASAFDIAKYISSNCTGLTMPYKHEKPVLRLCQCVKYLRRILTVCEVSHVLIYSHAPGLCEVVIYADSLGFSGISMVRKPMFSSASLDWRKRTVCWVMLYVSFSSTWPLEQNYTSPRTAGSSLKKWFIEIFVHKWRLKKCEFFFVICSEAGHIWSEICFFSFALEL